MDRDQARHALRTPLTVIKGVLSLLERADAILDVATRGELIERSVEQLRVLEDAIARVEAELSEAAVDEVVVVLYEESADGSVMAPTWPIAQSA